MSLFNPVGNAVAPRPAPSLPQPQPEPQANAAGLAATTDDPAPDAASPHAMEMATSAALTPSRPIYLPPLRMDPQMLADATLDARRAAEDNRLLTAQDAAPGRPTGPASAPALFGAAAPAVAPGGDITETARDESAKPAAAPVDLRV